MDIYESLSLRNVEITWRTVPRTRRKVRLAVPRGISARAVFTRAIKSEGIGADRDPANFSAPIPSKFLPPSSTPVYGLTALGWHFREIHEEIRAVSPLYWEPLQPIVYY